MRKDSKAEATPFPDLTPYPGGDLIEKGLADLKEGRQSEEALLVMIAAANLRRLGLPVPVFPEPAEPHEHALYRLIGEREPKGAHAEYNALIALLVSFEQTYWRAKRRSANG